MSKDKSKNKKTGKKMKKDNLEEKVAEQMLDESEKDKKIAELETQLQELKDTLLRKAAEFENYKRRTENEQMNLLKYAAENFIVKLLPIVDDFERSLQHSDDAQDKEAIKQGIKLVYDKLMKLLDEQGVKKIDAVGKPFDVEFHEALMQRKDDSVEPHTVLDEVEKGYLYKDKVIRHSKVVVSEDSPEQQTVQTENTQDENTED